MSAGDAKAEITPWKLENIVWLKATGPDSVHEKKIDSTLTQKFWGARKARAVGGAPCLGKHYRRCGSADKCDMCCRCADMTEG